MRNIRLGINVEGEVPERSRGLWKEISREAQVYQILQKAKASAVVVFLGTIDLAKTYFLHAAGEIRHMLVHGLGGRWHRNDGTNSGASQRYSQID